MTVVANICVYADQSKTKPIAIIVPAESALKKIAADLGLQGEHLEELIHEPKINSTILKQLQDAGRKGGLASFEIIDGVVLADEEWNPQNVSTKIPVLFFFRVVEPIMLTSRFLSLQGLTTAAQKLNRRGILDKYKKDVDKAYAHSG